MHTKYMRTAGRSYMVQKGCRKEDSFEFRMVRRCSLSSLVHMETIQSGDELECWYDLTGAQSLSGQMNLAPIGFETIKNLMLGINDMKKELDEYLISGEGISLSPENIFIDRARGNVKFCYIPENDKDGGGFSELAEEVIKHLDYSDTAGVRLGYYFLDLCGEENFTEDMCKSYIEKACEAAPTVDIDPEDGYEDEKRGEQIEDVIRPSGYVSRREKFKASLSGAFGIGKFVRKKNMKEETFAEYEEIPENNDTACLLGAEEYTWELSYEGERDEQSFMLKKFPFVIGKDASRVDGVLSAGTVSRIHASVGEEDGKLFILDNNSTNGTYLNGRLVPMNTKTDICEGDVIIMGTEKYRLIKYPAAEQVS